MTSITSTTCGQFFLIEDTKIEGTERLVVQTATNSTNIIGINVNGTSAMLDIPDHGKYIVYHGS